MSMPLSELVRSMQSETAFTVLAAARRLQADGKDVIELEIGDSPFPSTSAAKRAGLEAIAKDQTHYGPSAGLPLLRRAASAFVNREYGLAITPEQIVVGPGGKIFEQLFCEAFLDPGDGVLVFTPHFPTYLPNIARRQGRACLAPLREDRDFRPDPADVERFLRTDPRPRAIFLNSPHNPTGGVAALEDLAAIADLVRRRPVAVFSDEPYDRMVWRGKHHSILAQPGMIEQAVAAYTLSKSFSMSGWRVGFAVASQPVAEALTRLTNTTLSCVSPISQWAAAAALEHDLAESDHTMQEFRRKVWLLVSGLNRLPGVRCLEPAGTFYAFPNVSEVCQRLRLSSHGLAMYLLEGADDRRGVACLGGECFGPAGAGYLRFSCAEPDERMLQAVELISQAFGHTDRAAAYLARHPEYAGNSAVCG